MKTKLTTNNANNLYKFWGDLITDQINKNIINSDYDITLIKENPSDPINLLSMSQTLYIKIPKYFMITLGEKNIDCLSIDLDGSDYHIVEKILDNKINPSFFIVEIDQAIPPPVEIIPPKKNNPKQEMVMASLSAYNNLFIKHGYTLICCSSVMGHNAFFIQNTSFLNLKDIESTK